MNARHRLARIGLRLLDSMTWIEGSGRGQGHSAMIAGGSTGGLKVKFRVTIQQDEDGIFVVEVPNLPGCLSQGRTRTEAIENIKEAIAAYLESLEAHSEPIPSPISEEIVEVPF